MCERHLEDLLEKYPDDFFPDQGFQRQGRQGQAGRGRYDLLFKNNRGRYWLIEIKAVPLRHSDTDQLMRYYDELRNQHSDKYYIPCLVAPSISRDMQRSLARQRIEYEEITFDKWREVARKRGFLEPCSLLGEWNHAQRSYNPSDIAEIATKTIRPQRATSNWVYDDLLGPVIFMASVVSFLMLLAIGKTFYWASLLIRPASRKIFHRAKGLFAHGDLLGSIIVMAIVISILMLLIIGRFFYAG